MQHKVGVIGRFGFGKTLLNGQTIKTKTIVQAMENELGKDNILLSDTYGGVKALLRLPLSCLHMIRRCENVVILPAHKGIRVIVPLLALYNCFCPRKLHYVVIGGWITNMLKDRKFLRRCLKRFDWIYAETESMKLGLEEMGFENVVCMPNFKVLDILDEKDLRESSGEECRLCIFSRVMREKGIEDAVRVIDEINRQNGRTVYTLDIYGQVDGKQQQWFAELKNTFPEHIRYCGEVPYDKSVEILRDYDALLFPTKFYTEGIPGTIIDAYAAGVPVIASKWENYDDIVDDETGIGYGFGDSNGLKETLVSLVGKKETLAEMKLACLRKSREFAPEKAIEILLSRL